VGGGDEAACDGSGPRPVAGPALGPGGACAVEGAWKPRSRPERGRGSGRGRRRRPPRRCSSAARDSPGRAAVAGAPVRRARSRRPRRPRPPPHRSSGSGQRCSPRQGARAGVPPERRAAGVRWRQAPRCGARQRGRGGRRGGGGGSRGAPVATAHCPLRIATECGGAPRRRWRAARGAGRPPRRGPAGAGASCHWCRQRAPAAAPAALGAGSARRGGRARARGPRGRGPPPFPPTFSSSALYSPQQRCRPPRAADPAAAGPSHPFLPQGTAPAAGAAPPRVTAARLASGARGTGVARMDFSSLFNDSFLSDFDLQIVTSEGGHELQRYPVHGAVLAGQRCGRPGGGGAAGAHWGRRPARAPRIPGTSEEHHAAASVSPTLDSSMVPLSPLAPGLLQPLLPGSAAELDLPQCARHRAQGAPPRRRMPQGRPPRFRAGGSSSD
jgi:hypothetical protein